MKIYKEEGRIECGVDECGRGCLAGPVVAAAVVWPVDNIETHGIRDSKKLSPKKRKELEQYIKNHAIEWHVSFVDNTTIDRSNILLSTFQAMHMCLEKMHTPIDCILVDGDRFKPFKSIPYECVVKGDDLYVSIAAASILAKVARDEYMCELSRLDAYSKYAWEKNMGYGTKAHIEGVRMHGLSDMHRRTFCKSLAISGSNQDNSNQNCI